MIIHFKANYIESIRSTLQTHPAILSTLPYGVKIGVDITEVNAVAIIHEIWDAFGDEFLFDILKREGYTVTKNEKT